MRDTSERQEAIDAGTAKLVGTKTENIILFANKLLNNSEMYNSMSKNKEPIWGWKFM